MGVAVRGVVVPVAVPLTERREPDLDAYGHLIERLLAAGVDGIFANGSMGAFALLEDTWQERLVRAAVRMVGGRVPVLAGVSDTSPGRVLGRAERLEDAGVDAFVVMPPYYYLAGQAELRRFFEAVADRAPRPVVVYDNPRLTKNSLSAGTIVALSGHSNVAGVKLSGTEVGQWQELLRSEIDRSRFALISGAGRLTDVALRLGFDGITEGLHNVVPHLAVALWRASREGDLVAMGRVQERINRCFRIFDLAGGWQGLEVAFQWLGISPCAALPPYDLPLTREQREAIEDVLTAEVAPRPAELREAVSP